jgi:hypothetical protein
MSDNQLLVATEPWVLAADFESSAFKGALSEVRLSGGEVIAIDGLRMSTSDALFEEFSRSANLPDYFGRNWPALDECLADLEWLSATSYVVTLANPAGVLEAEPLTRATFARVIKRAATEWSEPVIAGEDWDRPSIPFHLVVDVRSRTDGRGELRPLAPNDAVAWLAG